MTQTPKPDAAPPPIPLTFRFHEALSLASSIHAGQARKGTTIPYIAHVLSVAALVLEDGGSEDLAIAALLHDALEDHPEKITRDAIAARFGKAVARMVQQCTDTPPGFVGGDKGPWRPRKEAYVAHLETNPAALRVSLADKVHNARSILADHREIGERIWERFSVEKEQTLWYYRRLVDAFRLAGATGRLMEELDRTVGEIERRAAEHADPTPPSRPIIPSGSDAGLAMEAAADRRRAAPSPPRRA
jgi:(p)ppGpp synthase/HD superfamily hydrolase